MCKIRFAHCWPVVSSSNRLVGSFRLAFLFKSHVNDFRLGPLQLTIDLMSYCCVKLSDFTPLYDLVES